jgi:peptide/nickel transport system substrate-binding protein
MGPLLTKLDYEDLLQNEDLVNMTFPALHYGSLGVNASVEPWSDPRVRQAIYLGVDRQQFIDKIGLGDGTPMGIINNGLDYWVLPQEAQEPYIGYDLQKAKELLSAAGYPDGFDFEIQTSNGVQLYIDHAEVLVAELANLGINATLKLTDLPTYLSTILFAANFDATVFTHNPYETPKIPLGFYHELGLGGGSWWHYNNPEITAMIDAQSMELDLEARRDIVHDTQIALLEDGAPMINWFSPTAYVSLHKRVKGYDATLRSFQNFLNTEWLDPEA